MYPHTCIDCGYEWSTKTDTKAKRCKSCQGKQVGIMLAQHNTKSEGDYKRYKRVCEDCGTVSMLSANPSNRKTQLCGMCSRQRVGRANAKEPSLTGEKVKHIRVCIACGDEKQVKTKEASTRKHCRACSNRIRTVNKKLRVVRQPRVTSKRKQVSEQAIEREREKNRLHREAQYEPETIPQVRTEEDMIAEYLKNNQPSIIARDDEEMPHLQPSAMYIAGTNDGVFI